MGLFQIYGRSNFLRDHVPKVRKCAQSKILFTTSAVFFSRSACNKCGHAQRDGKHYNPLEKKPSKLKKNPFLSHLIFFCNEWWQGQIKCTGNIPTSYGFKILIMVHKGWMYHSFQQRGIVHQANCFLFTQAP